MENDRGADKFLFLGGLDGQERVLGDLHGLRLGGEVGKRLFATGLWDERC